MGDDLAVWLRQAVSERLGLAQSAVSDGASAECWQEMTSGVLVTGPSDGEDPWGDVWPMGDSRLTRFIAANDPQDTIARCESELAILGEHATDIRPAGWGVPGQVNYWCQTCNVPGDFPGRDWCRTVLALAAGYRHAPGYRQEWKP
jgi:hypothetical protein